MTEIVKSVKVCNVFPTFLYSLISSDWITIIQDVFIFSLTKTVFVFVMCISLVVLFFIRKIRSLMKTMMKIIAKLTLRASEAKGGVTNLLVLFV